MKIISNLQVNREILSKFSQPIKVSNIKKTLCFNSDENYNDILTQLAMIADRRTNNERK